MEEEMAAVVSTIRKIHDAGKRVGVWTVNTKRSMKSFLDSEADMVITDDILLKLFSETGNIVYRRKK